MFWFGNDAGLCSCVFQLSSADLKKPLEKETAKLREMKEKLQREAPGKHTLFKLL